ncbi:MAG: glycosyltransferase [Clostridiales bacterium]|nr:glycosyltransferase [Clostridiales bacterium]
MATISLCMIVRDEEAVLDRCLASAAALADEIVIVDTGSADRTKEIAGRYTDRIYDFAWIDDFSAARNFSFSKGTKDYLMWLDADDVIEPGDLTAFLALKQELTCQTDLVMSPYHTALDSEGQPLFTYYRERLLRREAGFLWQGAVHEAIPPAGRIVYTEAAVTHRKERTADPDRNLRIFRKLLAAGKRLDPREQFYYAQELYGHKEYRQAKEVLLTFLREDEGWVENKIEGCRHLAFCYLAEGRRDQALAALFASFRYDLPRAEILCEIGQLFLEEGALQQAIYWYKQALSVHRQDATGAFVLPDCYNYLPSIQLCVCYDRMGNRALAEEYNEQAGRYKPLDKVYLHNKAYFSALRTEKKPPS